MATYYWTGGSGNWNDIRWATSSGGTPTGNVPQAGDNVVFDANSDTGSDFTVTTPSTSPSAKCLSITATGLDKRCTINASNGLTISGSVYGSSNFQVTGFVSLTPGSAQALDLQGQIFANVLIQPVVPGIGYTLLSNITSNITLYANSPTLQLNGYTLTCSSFDVVSGALTLDGTLFCTSLSGPGGACSANLGATTSGTGTVRISGGTASVALGNAAGANVVVEGTYPVSFSGATSIASLDCTTASGALSFNNTLTVYGGIRTGSMTGTMAYAVSLAGASGPYAIQSNGALFNFSNTISISTGVYQLASALSITGGVSLVSGTFNANGYAYTAGFFSSNNSNVRTLTMGAGTWTLTGNNRTVWDLATTTNLTLSAASAPIVISNTSGTASFYGGSQTYKSITITGSTPATTIYGSNTIGSFNTTTNAGTTVTFESGSTSTFSQFLATGYSGKVLTLRSTTPGSQSTLVFNNGNINCDYTDIKDSATGGTSLWYAGVNSTNSGNNSGWIFGAGSTGSMLGLLWA